MSDLLAIACVWGVFARPVAMQAYSNTGAGLTEFPSDVPTDATQVDVSENGLPLISASQLAGFTNLISLVASHNLLTALPDVRPVGETLSSLTLAHNQISVVDPAYLTGVTALQYLYLEGNNLTVFPDLGDSKPSLLWLFIFDNPILQAPLHTFLDFHNLFSFHFQGNQLESFPNTCDASFWSRQRGFTSGLGSTRCDCRLLHVFLAKDWTGDNTINELWKCKTPDTLAGMGYDSGLKMADLICNASRDGVLMKLVRSNYYCHYPYLTESVAVDSAGACASLCMKTEGCYYFNLREESVSRWECHVTSVFKSTTNVTSIQNTTGWKYYSLL